MTMKEEIPNYSKTMASSTENWQQFEDEDGDNFCLGIHSHPDEVDASIGTACWLLSCPVFHFGLCPYRTVLLLDKYEVTRQDVTVCGKRTLETRYSDIGDVEVSHCCCCVCVDASGIGTLLPGTGCDSVRATEIAQLLKDRIPERRESRQGHMSETIVVRTLAIEDKFNSMESYFDHPQKTFLEQELDNPPQQESMSER
mmetsp:Transcript_23115/g.48148  ORF Transcript_23115/g.48148 Transcript_23115/m.48148 type:complete len:199 (-) Transcript_23115:69-665(-)|eukprot:CAMPEP_0172459174 /NCGR_PEP_ID=MMETSP1065-20121228/31351_1 /TAXON_ID=265537 /ORGANISM="Amphiprora paludosa, Strain CCMP125" /LENGTH=198 /DNA_ID=CAMNT_0013213761 /DNA_START=65 /DNA_END=661 /DNA_ORIENTATION=-